MDVGYAQDIITPSLDRPVYLAGFGQNRRAETIHDNLYVRALALRDASRTLVLVALDLIGFFRRDACEVIQRVREKAPGAEVISASLHPHHGPDTMGLWGPDDRTRGVDPLYLSGVKEKIVAAALASMEALKPVRGMKAACLHVPGLVKNARDPGIVDDELTVLQFLNPDGRPMVTLFNFPCHPEVLWEHNPHISADYVGYLRGEVERTTGAACLFLSADLGGMLTPDVKDHSFEEAESMGKALARAGLEALEKTAISETPPALSLQKKEIQVKLTNILFKIAFRRGLLPDERDERGRIHSEVNLLKVGPAWFAAVPGELLPRLGIQLRADLRAAGAGFVGVIGLANDELGYILPKKDFRYPLNPLKPGKHYEETMSIGKEMGPVVMDAVRELIGG